MFLRPENLRILKPGKITPKQKETLKMLLKKLVFLKLKKERMKLFTLRMIPTIIYSVMKKTKKRKAKSPLLLTLKNLLK